MKKILILLSFSIAIYSCKKKDDNVSQVVVASYPTITLTGDQFYSIKTGGAIPTVSATAYDSVIRESYTPSLDASGIDNTVPGLYVVDVTATNKYGFIGRRTVFIAVTDVDEAMDLSGVYIRSGNKANVTKIKNGLYRTDNVGGAAAPSNTVAYFAQLNDTTIDLPVQPTADGDIGVRNGEHPDDYGTLILSPSDTSFYYRLNEGGSLYGTTATRVFSKQ